MESVLAVISCSSNSGCCWCLVIESYLTNSFSVFSVFIMSLFSSAFSKLFGCFTPFFRQRETQQCAAQELAAMEKFSQSEALNVTANPKKSSKKHRKRPKKLKKVKHLQTPAQPTVLKPIKGKRPKLSDNSVDFTFPAASFQPLPPLKRPPLLLLKQPQCASDELFSCRLSSVCPLSHITVEEPQHDFVLPGCPLQVPPPKVLAVPPPRPVAAPDELFSFRFSSVCPLSPIAVEEPQHDFVLPGCPLQVPPPKVLAVPPPRPVAAPDELFSFRFSSVCPLSPIAVEEPQHDFVLPGCPLQVPPPKVLAVPPPSPVAAPDELFSCQFSSVCPLSPMAVEEPQHDFVLPGCPLQVPPPKVLAVPPPRPVAAPDELFSSQLSLKRPLSPIPAAHESALGKKVCPSCLKEHLSTNSVQSASTSEEEDEEYEDDKVLEDESWMSELIELQNLSESGDSVFCPMPLGGAESQLKVTVQNEPKSQLVQLSWADKVKDWMKRKLQK